MALKPQPSSNNPAWRGLRNVALDAQGGAVITRAAIAWRTAFLLAACIGAAAAGWLAMAEGVIAPNQVTAIFAVCAIGYLALSFIVVFKPMSAQWLATPAVTVEGVALGMLTMMVDAAHPGIASEALLATLTVGVVTWFAYASGVVRPGPRFVKIVVIATISVAVLYAVNQLMVWLLPSSPLNAMINGNSPLAIGFSLLMVGLASMNLFVDYVQADALVEARAPKALAWYSAWAVMVTLIWLYVEMLRLLSKLNSRR